MRGGARYARIGARHAAAGRAAELGWPRWPVLVGFAALVVVTLGVPLGMIVYWLTQHGAAAISPVEVSAARLLDATASASLGSALAGAAVTRGAGAAARFPGGALPGRLITLLERAAYLAQGVPGIVVALALISLTVHALRPLYQSAALLIVAYAILFLPLALVSVRAALVQAQRGLEEAGRSLGLGWAAVAWRVLLPLAGPGLGAAAALVFVSVVTELTATLLLAPIGTQTLATQVWADTSTLAFAAAAPYAALMVALSLLSDLAAGARFGALRRLEAVNRSVRRWRACDRRTEQVVRRARPVLRGVELDVSTRGASGGDPRRFRQRQDHAAAAASAASSVPMPARSRSAGASSPGPACMCRRSSGASAMSRRKARCSRISRWPTISCSACRGGSAGTRHRVGELLELVGLPAAFADRPPQAAFRRRAAARGAGPCAGAVARAGAARRAVLRRSTRRCGPRRARRWRRRWPRQARRRCW